MVMLLPSTFGAFSTYSHICQKLREVVKHMHAAGHMSHLSSTEAQSNLHAVPFGKEFLAAFTFVFKSLYQYSEKDVPL